MSELETITASLAEGYKQLEPDSFRTSAELTTERRTNKELRSGSFYTANFAIHTVEDGEDILYFGGRHANPILANIDEACEQLITKHNYEVKPEDMKTVRGSVESNQTLRVKFSDLHLGQYHYDYSFFEVDTKDYDSLNDSQRPLAEWVYGSGDDFIENMKMLADEGVTTIRIYLFNPNSLKEQIDEGRAFARACWLHSFKADSNFNAYDTFVNVSGGLRGELSQKQ